MTTPATTVSFVLDGMNCMNCVRHVNEALQANVPLIDQAIDLAHKKLTVTFDPASTSREAIAATLNEAGYPVVSME